MSEQEPLLPAYNSTQGHGSSDSARENGDMDPLYYKCRQKTAQIIEHPTLHKIIIALVSDFFFQRYHYNLTEPLLQTRLP